MHKPKRSNFGKKRQVAIGPGRPILSIFPDHSIDNRPISLSTIYQNYLQNLLYNIFKFGDAVLSCKGAEGVLQCQMVGFQFCSLVGWIVGCVASWCVICWFASLVVCFLVYSFVCLLVCVFVSLFVGLFIVYLLPWFFCWFFCLFSCVSVDLFVF